jgi:hypothetical protein
LKTKYGGVRVEFKELARFYARFHRKLTKSFPDLERRAADFYFLLPEPGLNPRLKPPNDLQLQGFWQREAKRLAGSKKKNFKDEQQAWRAAYEAFHHMLQNIQFRYKSWKEHKEKNLPDQTCLALTKLSLGKLELLAKEGITTTVSYHFAGKDKIKSIRGIGEKTIQEMNQKIPKPRKSHIQPSLLDL